MMLSRAVSQGAVFAIGKDRRHVIRSDLPTWNDYYQCWEYFYTEGSGA